MEAYVVATSLTVQKANFCSMLAGLQPWSAYPEGQVNSISVTVFTDIAVLFFTLR